MSAFFHTSSGASVRSRRGKDRETKPRTNSISSTGRRHKDSSKSHDNKSPPSKSPVLQPTTLYAQQNLALEQLPSLPSSAATSPTLSSSGVRSSIVGPNKAGIYQLTQQPYTPAALQQYLERDTEEAEEAQENELTKSLHLPPRPQDSCKTDEAQTGECSTPSNIEDAVAEAVYRDEATPLANTHGSERSRKVFGPPPSAEQFQSPSASSKKSHWRRSGPAPAMEKHGSLDRLSKQATSVSDPGADVEGFYKPCEELENRIDTLQFNMHRSLPMRSTVSAESRAGRQTASEDSQTGPYTGQRSTPSTLRTFTPPAPPFPVASSPVLPAFASPVPLRARPSAEPHMGYQQSSGYSLRHPSSVNQGYFYGHHTLQHHLEAGPLQFGPLAEGPPRSDLPVSTVPSNITGHETGEVNRTELFDNTMGLLHKLYNALPRMRMLVANLQYTGASNTIANCKYKVDDDYSKLLKQKEERIEELLGNFDEHKRRHLTESDKLKSDLMSMEKKSVNLQMELLSRQRSRDSIEREIKASKQEVAYTKIKLQEDSLAKANDVESRMSTVKLNLQEKSEEVSVLRQKISEMEATWAQERENAEANCVRRVMQLETAHQGERAELEKLLGVEQHELLVLRKNDTDARKAWDDERRELVHKLDVERQHATDERERERRSIEQHWQAINEIQRKEHSAVIEEIKVSHELSLREQQKTYGILETENKRLQQENKRLEDAWNSDKARFAKTASDFRSAATRMNEQNLNMQKMIEAFGDVTNVRSQGDDYFVNAFTTLIRQIQDIASDVHMAAGSPAGKQSGLASPNISNKNFLPSNRSDDADARKRCYLFMNVVSQLLCQRVFAPFIFTLGHQHREANELFGEFSRELREWSPLREAAWRQRTLHAAYTSARNRRSANDAVTSIVREIVQSAEGLICMGEQQGVAGRIHKMVKLAAETWQCSRYIGL